MPRFTLPESVGDFLFGELRRKQALEKTLRANFSLWGYDEVLPAGLDFFDNFTRGPGARPQEGMLKSFDGSGRILAMRPEFTAQLARLAGSKLAVLPPPLRLCYLGPVYAGPQGKAGHLSEFTQAGVELMGPSSPEADAEVVLLALSLMREAGLQGTMVELGQIGFFKGLMEESGLRAEAIAELRAYVEQKNALAIELLLRDEKVPAEAARRIMELPMLFGGGEVLQSAAKRGAGVRCAAAIENLRRIYELVCACGFGDQVVIDLGMAPSLSYYTGLVFRGLTASLGRPVLTGGRYDGLLAEYGRDLPATGFALEVEGLLEALLNETAEESRVDLIYAVDARSFAEAFAEVSALRAQGLRVELCFESDPEKIRARAAQRGAARVMGVKE
ncbi:MAG: ATP phosphoribosyltransferase regulatory subunit [Christensenellaceae bacterium]|jgi:ATP phosphoribosyltransferase regulatory subunit|nr:ATP phosphoribosyltransferase regulatory subunit [Christensenellaceae bacterium]